MTFPIPLSTGLPAPAAGPHPPATGPLSPSLSTARLPRVLVVDDQRLNVQVLYQVFAADHQVLMATSGEQALKVAAEQQPDLVLLDVEMPGMDGHEVCRRLKAEEATRDIPVIFVTAHSAVEQETQGLALGAVDFISKPVNPAIVRARARTHLTLKAQADLLRQWVYIDGLTEVANRRQFDARLQAECSRAMRNGTDLTVMMLDVDFFKRFNDRYGHQAGDDCLRRVAACLRESVRRPADLVARYGGEEFACLLPETALAGAVSLAESLCRHVQALAVPHETSDAAAHVTVSIGVCTRVGAQPCTAQSLVQQADAMLYAAKTQGRNRALGRAFAAAGPGPG